MAVEQILGLGRSIAWSQMKPCILSWSPSHTVLVLLSEKFPKTLWGRERYYIATLVLATFSSGICDNKTALLRIIWRWIDHEFLATLLLHRKVKGCFISSLCCVFLANNFKGKIRRKRIKRSLLLSSSNAAF